MDKTKEPERNCGAHLNVRDPAYMPGTTYNFREGMSITWGSQTQNKDNI